MIISVLYAERSPGTTGLDNNTDATLLLDLDGLAVARVERLEDGTRRVHLVTTDHSARACPACGVLATKVKGPAVTRPRDLPCGERDLHLVWHKQRWYCTEPLCPRKSFTEQVRQIPAGARITQRLRQAAGRGCAMPGPPSCRPPATCACPGHGDGRLPHRRAGSDGRCTGAGCGAGDRRDPPRTAAVAANPDTGRWEPAADRWHTGFVDAFGVQGLLGQVEGRAPSDVLAWLAGTDLRWRRQIRYVAIDMSAGYRAAVRTGLPHTTIVVDHFHVVQLANKMLSIVRRRTTATLRGRRGRATDPEWKARRRLLRNREDLSDEQFTKMWNTLINAGTIGMTLLTAWIAKERLRDLLATARIGVDRERIGHLRWKFLTWCADSDIPEVRQLATTIDRWWTEIEAFIHTGHSNAKSEGINRVIKLVARAAHGFRNPTNQRLRTRCVTTRRARGHLRTA